MRQTRFHEGEDTGVLGLQTGQGCGEVGALGVLTVREQGRGVMEKEAEFWRITLGSY